jgi:hypothetical protein
LRRRVYRYFIPLWIFWDISKTVIDVSIVINVGVGQENPNESVIPVNKTPGTDILTGIHE